MVEPAIFGPLDTYVAPYIEWILLGLVIVNLLTRSLAHRRHVDRAEDDADEVGRWPLHVATNVLLVLGAFYYATVAYHAGMVLSTLVLGTVIADFFEIEARNVEVRNDMPIEKPKGAIAASLLMAAYAAYKALFFLIEAPLSQII